MKFDISLKRYETIYKIVSGIGNEIALLTFSFFSSMFCLITSYPIHISNVWKRLNTKIFFVFEHVFNGWYLNRRLAENLKVTDTCQIWQMPTKMRFSAKLKWENSTYESRAPITFCHVKWEVISNQLSCKEYLSIEGTKYSDGGTVFAGDSDSVKVDWYTM